MKTMHFNDAESPDFNAMHSFFNEHKTNILAGTLNVPRMKQGRCVIKRESPASEILLFIDDAKINETIGEIRNLLEFFTPDDPRDF